MFIVYLLPSHSALIFNTFRLSLCVTFVNEEIIVMHYVQYACLVIIFPCSSTSPSLVLASKKLVAVSAHRNRR